MLTFIALCAFSLARSELPAGQEETAPVFETAPKRLRLKADLTGRYNPLGLKLRADGIYRRGIGLPPIAGWPTPYLETGIALGLTPANASTSVHFEWMQLAFLVLRVQGDLFRYFGTRGVLLEFPNGNARYGDDEVAALSGRELSRFGGRLLVQPTLRVKVGRFALRNQTDLAWYRFGKGGPYFREPESNSLLEDGDGLVVNRTALLVELWSGGDDATLLVGPSYDFQRTFSAGLERQRLSGVASFCPADRLGILARPRFGLQVGTYLQDRNRKGQFFVGGGIGADLDL